MTPINYMTTIAGTVLLVVVVAAVATLGWHGTLAHDEVYGILTTIVALAGGAFAVGHGAKIGARAAHGKTDQTRGDF
jgi:uncharacterized membrane protein